MQNQMWQKGDVILDQYEVRSKLGEGGMGAVYQVYHRGWNMDLAVKRPQPIIFAHTGGKENFIREAETWVNLTLHPHIVSCYYVRMVDDLPLLFAEYVEGGSLEDWIRGRRLYEGGPQKALVRMLDIAIQFAWGLHAAHEQGVIHQDIKPANVMMTQDGVAKVTDFGLARARVMAGEQGSEDGTGQCSILVSARGMTPAYCSPEQAAGKALSRKTDIWSWGVSLLEMWVGEVTWRSGILAHEILAGYEPQDAAIPPLPAGLVKLLARCFAFQPEERPTTMLEVAITLQEIYAREIGQVYPREAPQAARMQADILNNRALSLYDLGKIEEAKQAWEQALQIDPQHLEGTYNQGLIRWRLGEIPDDVLIQQLEQIQNEQSQQWKASFLLAQVHLERGDIDTASSQLKRAKQQTPTEAEVQRQLEAIESNHMPSIGCRYMLQEHTDRVTSVSLSADGHWLISGSRDRLARLWDVDTGQCIRTFQEHTSGIETVKLSADGRWLLTFQSRITDLASIVELRQETKGAWLVIFSDPASPQNSVEVIPVILGSDGRWHVVGDWDWAVQIWEVSSGRCVLSLRGDPNDITSANLSTDGRWLISGHWDGTVRIWDISTEKCVHTFQHPSDSANQVTSGPRGEPIIVPQFKRVHSVNLSANGRWLVSNKDNEIQLWDVNAEQCMHTFHGIGNVEHLSSDGHWLVSSKEDKIHLWDMNAGLLIRTFQGHSDSVTAVSLSSDGRWLASGSQDHTVRLWDVNTGQCMRTFQSHTASITSVSLSANGHRHRLASACEDGTVHIWEINDSSLEVRCSLQPSYAYSYTDLSQREILAEHLLVQVEQACIERRFAVALKQLREVRALPGWERRPKSMEVWAKLSRYCARIGFRAAWLLKTIRDDSNSIDAVSLSADGRWFISGSKDGVARLWEVSSGKCIHTFQDHSDSELSTRSTHEEEKVGLKTVNTVKLSADGRWLVSRSKDGMARLWEVNSWKCVCTLRDNTGSIRAVSLSADGRWLVLGSHSSIRLWDVSTGRRVRTFQGEDVTCVSLSADGRWLISGGWSNSVQLWEVSSGKCVHTFQGHTDYITSVSLSTDGRWLISGSRDKTARLWDVNSGRCIRTFQGHTRGVRTVCLSMDGSLLVSGGEDRMVRLWEVSSGKCVRTFQGHTDSVTSVSLSADGSLLVSGSKDKTMRLWVVDWELEARDLADWDEGTLPFLEAFLAQHTPYIGTLPQDHSPSRQEIQDALTRRGKPVWTEQDFQQLLQHLQWLGYGWLRPESIRKRLQLMAVEDMIEGEHTKSRAAGMPRSAWQMQEKKAHTLIHTFNGHQMSVNAAYLSLDGKMAVSGSEDTTIRVWEIATGQCVHVLRGHKAGVTSICSSVDGNLILSGGRDRTMRLWEVATGQCLHIFQGYPGTVSAVSLSTDGRLALSGNIFGTLRLWDVATEHCLQTIQGKGNIISGVGLSRDGLTAISANDAGTIQVWNVQTGDCLHTFQGHTEAVTSLSWSADEHFLLSGGKDTTVRLWDLSTGHWMLTFQGHTEAVTSLSWSADGQLALSGSEDGTLRMWEIASGRCLSTLMLEHRQAVTSVCLSTDGKLALSGQANGSLRLWALD